jgi:hypothetical protein
MGEVKHLNLQKVLPLARPRNVRQFVKLRLSRAHRTYQAVTLAVSPCRQRRHLCNSILQVNQLAEDPIKISPNAAHDTC